MSDMLLEWMSYRGEGRFDELPPELRQGSPWRVLGDFSMLGHVEMVTPSNWKISPPVLAGLPSEQGSQQFAVLCGARTPGVLTHVAHACSKSNAELRVTAIPGRPSLIHIVCPSKSALASVAAGARIPLQSDAGYTLLACLPTIRDWPRTPCAMVAGRIPIVRRFSRSRMQWVASSLAEATAARTGFFRVKRDWDWVSILKSRQTECAYVDDRAGRLFIAAKLRAASWSANSRTLSLPIQLYPPAPIARALTLCTGTLPQYDGAGGRLLFGAVNLAMLKLALAITGLRLT